jgi:hypothetical protein
MLHALDLRSGDSAEDHMAENDRNRMGVGGSSEPARHGSENSSKKADSAEHRLRGAELESDFVDAEGDSCVVHKHRTDAESDS